MIFEAIPCSYRGVKHEIHCIKWLLTNSYSMSLHWIRIKKTYAFHPQCNAIVITHLTGLLIKDNSLKLHLFSFNSSFNLVIILPFD